MKRLPILACTLAALATAAIHAPAPAIAKQGMPPGLAKQGGIPPGLRGKCLPPGHAKRWALGQHLPRDCWNRADAWHLKRLPYAGEGREWVRVARDFYLIAVATGIIVDVVEGWDR
ncbi:MAG: RcnB family protein [Alphaproteobacteria bacterium]|nr:RcnB family protein [Alphaproteobacteria bacterium]MDX5369551.1 RcnB family protein [Alphaproteobacteria bacterium]